MARSEKQVSIAYNGNTVEFTFRQPDGSFGEKFVFNAEAAHENNRRHAELFGWNQRLVDSVASESGAAAKRAGIVALGEWYMAGGENWEQTRKGGATGPRIATGDVVTAIARLYYSGDIDKTNRLIDKRSAKDETGRDETIMALYRGDPDIVAEVVKIMAARKGMTGKANSMLDEMEDEAE